MNPSYEDMLDLPHPVSKNHPQMSIENRAAQFSPFAALTGHEEAIEETARVTECFCPPGEKEQRVLDEKVRILREQLSTHPSLTVTYFLKDQKKEGGSYVTVTGMIRRIDEEERTFVFTDTTVIPIKDIVQLEGEIFWQLEKSIEF